jgi:hypothetical protein
MARDANGEVWVERGGQLDSYDYLWDNCGPGDRKQRDHPYRIDLLNRPGIPGGSDS